MSALTDNRRDEMVEFVDKSPRMANAMMRRIPNTRKGRTHGSAPTFTDMSVKGMLLRYFRVNRRDIAYFRFTLEAYEGLATLTTLDARNGIVVLSIPECFAGEVDALLAAFAQEIGLTEIASADDLPFPLKLETHNDA